jgi:hypothetical protein
VPLDEVDHPLLRKANDQFADEHTTRERIVEIDDQILFKVKVQRWRGAVWTEPRLAWLVAAGVREAGSTDDFYAALAADGRTARARYNAAHATPLSTATHTEHLFPGAEDRERLHAEAGVRFERRLQRTVLALVQESLRDGQEHSADLGSFRLGVQVRADQGHETYVAVRITGSVPLNLVGAILDLVPGCDPQGWFPEFTGLPGRPLLSGEVAWSNIMDPLAAAKLLESEA